MPALTVSIDRPTFLRRVLTVDATTSAAMGVALALDANALAGLLELPAGLVAYAGLSLLPFAAVVAWLGTRAIPPRPGVWAVIAANLVWVVASVVLLASGAVAPNALGYAFVVAQAIAVAVLAELVAWRHQRGLPEAGLLEAVDPVCGMTVAVTAETPSAQHAGETYWFCCDGCRERFVREPKEFLAAT